MLIRIVLLAALCTALVEGRGRNLELLRKLESLRERYNAYEKPGVRDLEADGTHDGTEGMDGEGAGNNQIQCDIAEKIGEIYEKLYSSIHNDNMVDDILASFNTGQASDESGCPLQNIKESVYSLAAVVEEILRDANLAESVIPHEYDESYTIECVIKGQIAESYRILSHIAEEKNHPVLDLVEPFETVEGSTDTECSLDQIKNIVDKLAAFVDAIDQTVSDEAMMEDSPESVQEAPATVATDSGLEDNKRQILANELYNLLKMGYKGGK